jgi:hypothetical protein
MQNASVQAGGVGVLRLVESKVIADGDLFHGLLPTHASLLFLRANVTTSISLHTGTQGTVDQQP